MKRPRARAAILSVLIVGVVIFAIVIYFWNTVNDVFQPVPGPKKVVNLTVQEGESTAQIADDLQQKGLIRNALAFRVWARIKGLDTKLQAGVYKNVSSTETISDIVDQLQQAQPDEIIVRIKEGSRIEEIARLSSLKTLPNFKPDDFLKYTRHIDQFPDSGKYPLLKEVPDGNTMEGLLFPDTYYVPVNATARDFVNYMLKEMSDTVTKDNLAQKAQKNNMTTYQFLTLASIVEREAPNNDHDRHMIASVYWNRINTDAGKAETGGLMQADPTVQYARDTDQPPSIYWQPLQDSPSKISPNNKYNTYVQTGWPPAPICTAGLKSLEAAADPTQSDNLYFFTAKDGKTIYAKTNAEFEQKKNQFGVSQ